VDCGGFAFGARLIKGYIQSEIETMIGRAILKGNIEPEHGFVVNVAGSTLTVL